MNDGIYILSDDGKTLLGMTDENITEAVIPEGVTHIGKYAFAFCLKLTSIHIRITDIDSCRIEDNAFYRINFDNCILYVPHEAIEAYRKHPAFCKFKEIKAE